MSKKNSQFEKDWIFHQKIILAWYRGPVGVFDGWKLINLIAFIYSLVNLLKRRLFWFYCHTSHA